MESQESYSSSKSQKKEDCEKDEKVCMLEAGTEKKRTDKKKSVLGRAETEAVA